MQKSLFGGFFYERGREVAEHHGLFRVSLTETESRTQLSYFSAIVRAHRGGVCHGQGNDTQAEVREIRCRTCERYSAEENWRKLGGFAYLANIIEGVKFVNGEEFEQLNQVAA